MSRQGFEDEVASLLLSTTQFDNPTKQKLGSRFVALYPAAWEGFLKEEDPPLTDTPQNRGAFIARNVVNYVNDIYKAGHVEEFKDTAPPIEEIP